ncbi:MAG: QueT transporter family protein [Thaumarchaeota archaeon]|nr:QueT transporter family protein [Nitrososphaerota archaeon]
MKRTVVVATAAVYAAMYAGITIALGPISYGGLNFRVANALLGLVPILGWPAVIGQGLGVVLANAYSPYSLDTLNAIPSFAFAWLIWKLRKVGVFLGLTIYSVALGTSVSLVIGYPNFDLVYSLLPLVTLGIFVVTAVLGYILYKAAGRSEVLRRRYQT